MKTLDLNDLLLDENNDALSDYLRVSISNDGNGATVTVSTVDEHPVVYTSVFHGSTATDLAEMLASCEHLDSGNH
jgi:hypothetical protein